MLIIYGKIRHARYLYIKRNVKKVRGARYTLGARYLSKNTVFENYFLFLYFNFHVMYEISCLFCLFKYVADNISFWRTSLCYYSAAVAQYLLLVLED